MKKHLKTIISLFLAIVMFTMVFPYASAIEYPETKLQTILNSIKTDYSQSLKDKISDLIYDSDYSDIISSPTLRCYATNGNSKSWPISNADSYGVSVTDRGNIVKWGWGSAGCMSYACFFTYSVYGSIGTTTEKVNLNDSNIEKVKELFTLNAQPGEHIRINNKHSIIFLNYGNDPSTNEEGFYYCEYWGGGSYDSNTKTWSFSSTNDQYNISFVSYSNFIKKYKGIDFYIYNAYESSSFATDTNNETNPATITRDIVLVLDVSGSMSGTKIANTKTAAKSFVNQIISSTTNTRIALVKYDSYVSTVSDFTRDGTALTNAINSLSAGSNTNIYGALTQASSLLDAGTAKKKSIVLMTDGEANEGTYTSSGTRLAHDGSNFSVTSYGAAIYDLTKDYKEVKGYYIYTLGFGLSTGSTAYNLLKNICSVNSASEDKFWSVSSNNVNDLTIAFDDIAGSNTSNKSIRIVIDCPIDVSIAYNGFAMSSIGLTGSTSSSFGSITATGSGIDRNIELKLAYHEDYILEIIGTDTGTMDLKVEYTSGDVTTHRTFIGVPVTNKTIITTSNTDYRADFALYVDKENDGRIDSGWEAAVNETVRVKSDDIVEQLYPTNSSPLGVFGFDCSDLALIFKESRKLNIISGAPENGSVQWSTSNKSVAKIDNGVVTGKGTGSAVITAKALDENGKELSIATCNVTVKLTWWQWILKILLFGWIWYY